MNEGARTETAGTRPGATARLQLHRHFTFDDAAACVPYLADLGITHLYISPILRARQGSVHGYDIVDHGTVNPELGGEPGLRRLVAALRRRGMGLIVDIVPNHMAVGGSDNAWWLDVLEWGRASPYADFFDIDWEPPDPALRGKVLVPFLGNPYGVCLAGGDIALRCDEGRIAAVYADHVFPIALRHYPVILAPIASRIADLPDLSRAPATRAAARASGAAMKSAVRRFAATDSGAAALAQALDRYAPASPDGRDRLHHLLERQHYRLVWWQAAADEINWRRFFDITSLAGLRVELPQVFDATHATLLRLYGAGLIDGVRVDHIDGLADPRAYCRKLRRRMDAAAATRPQDAPAGPAFIVVEKILASQERLPADWRTDGTTGYDFMDQVGALLHDPAGEAPLTALWTELAGSADSFEDVEHAARRLTLRDALASELNATAAALHRVARRDLATRDYTLTGIRRALVEILVHFPVYRLYAGLTGRRGTDDRAIARALAGARRSMRAADRPLLDLIGLWLGGEAPRELPPGPLRRERLRAIVRFEQLSSPVAAKSVEDTAFYRYGRLLSRNEVGSNPGRFAMPPAAFHAACLERARQFPHALLAIATHDHKRGEDVRARLSVLSEIPEEWAACLRRWTRLNAPLKRDVDGAPAPDMADEVMLYQMLIGAWLPDIADTGALAERLAAWQLKALREAKRHTAWIAPNDAYEGACRDFLFQMLDGARPSRVVDDMAAFAARLGPAGAVKGLAQTVLRMTTPGIPDLYQGTELWDGSMVDPDNRAPVDYARRQAMLAARRRPSDLLQTWEAGEIKQAVMARVLALRARRPDVFAAGSYRPLAIEGPHADRVVAFSRQGGGTTVIVVALIRPAALLGDHPVPHVPAERWRETAIMTPDEANGRYDDVLGDRTVTVTDHSLPVSVALAHLPVAVLAIAADGLSGHP
ncbi:malto-oligosyltrehalose synthase [Rhodopila sp.]|uniref:malto-oligosyltrehalose synthase n=1 Tax=Rhodopila sp. TaxID=2480087 RepID=UPI002CB9D16C|nr:malto-oligosyltrehalose synthase [Rhodopila sp.]HVZ10049.1 malto-oligosyltrehalose synthase [Rhodopila sp.]